MDLAKTVFVVPNFATESECSEIISWALDEQKNSRMIEWMPGCYTAAYRFFDPSNTLWGKDEFNRVMPPLKNIPDKFIELRNRIRDQMGFHWETKRGNSASFLSVMFEGAQVTDHLDSGVEDHVHMRCNVCLSDGMSANPVISGTSFELKSGDLICFAADSHKHGTTVNLSKTPRVLASYPFVMPCSGFSTNPIR